MTSTTSPTASPTASGRRGVRRVGGPWTTFWLCATATYIGTLDFSIVNVAFIGIISVLAYTLVIWVFGVAPGVVPGWAG